MTASQRRPWEIPPLWLLLALLTIGALHTWLPIANWIEWPWSSIGLVIIAAAMVLLVSCERRFHRAKTGIRPFTPAHQLVIEGAYRFTRNPMYLGLMGVCVGVTIQLGTISPLLVLPVFFLVLDRRFVRPEEIFLRERFGAAFDEYCGRVRRWL